MIQDLHMLKEKNRVNCIYCSMLDPFLKMDESHNFEYEEKKNKKKLSFESFSNSTPLIRGKKVSYSDAILEVKKNNES